MYLLLRITSYNCTALLASIKTTSPIKIFHLIFLAGPVRNVYFPFDIVSDTPVDVATEMVKELEITDWEPLEIADMIEGEISSLVPNGKKWPHPNFDHRHILNYQEDDDDDHRHPFNSFSSCSSSQTSISGLITSHRLDEMSRGGDWLQGMVLNAQII